MDVVVKTLFVHRAAAASVMRKLVAKHGNNLTIKPIAAMGTVRYIIVRKEDYATR